MQRKFYNILADWKKRSNGTTALLIQGARRIGKSYIAEKFAKNEYRSYILIDFNIAEKSIKELFENDISDLDTFFLKLSVAYGKKLFKRESLIIFDEVQLFPRARSLIKYLVADGRYDYIETGSLISIKENVKNILIPSEEEHFNMYPMDFEEFMWAFGEEQLSEYIKKCFAEKQPLGQALHRKVMNLFRQYLIIGGMPKVVDTFRKTKDFEEVERQKQLIINLYRDDIQKHSKGYSVKVKAIFDEIPNQLKNQNRHFKLASIEENARFKDFEEPLFWLDDAMIVNNCYNSSEPNIGLGLNKDRTILKCYMADTGLLLSLAFNENGNISKEIYKKILLDKLEINLGMIIENVVSQMLTASNHKLYFFTSNSHTNKNDRMEIDFLISKKDITNRHNINPIEVKSSKNYTLTSLKKFKTKYKEYVGTCYVIHPEDFTIKEDIIFLPIYMTPLL